MYLRSGQTEERHSTAQEQSAKEKGITLRKERGCIAASEQPEVTRASLRKGEGSLMGEGGNHLQSFDLLVCAHSGERTTLLSYTNALVY